MSVTISLVQLKRKKRKNGEIPIYLRITENRKSRYKSTGISVLPKHWNTKKQQIRKSHSRYKPLNSQLDRHLLEAEKAKVKLKHEDKLEASTLKSEIKQDHVDDIIHVIEAYHEQLDTQQRYWEKKRMGVVVNNLKSFLGNRTVRIDKVDADFIEKFQNYLLSEVGNNPNTVRRKLTSLKGFFNHLLKSNQIKHDPFLRVDKVSEKAVEKTKLTIDQIHAIENLELQPNSDLWHTRNYFLYSFYNAGIRFGDLCTLQWKNIVDGRLTYKMQKTGGHKSIAQLSEMQEILHHYQHDGVKSDDYIFPILDKQYSDPMELRRAISSKNVIVNRHLKEIGRLAKIETNISFHVSRHSFSQYALEKGMNLYQISKALGHSDLKTTEQYLKAFDEELLDEGMKSLFNN